MAEKILTPYGVLRLGSVRHPELLSKDGGTEKNCNSIKKKLNMSFPRNLSPRKRGAGIYDDHYVLFGFPIPIFMGTGKNIR
ncbi:MAG: hypothetical protein NTY34_07650, partial [Candidatus Omnitrophica bacterium]|nr:hypothetical protein [Candidatus Omnitrophota bacterium]